MKLTRNQLKELIRQSIDELKEDKGDMDGDGKNEPDSEEYMDNKDKAIKKAMKNEGGKGSGRPAKPGGAKDTENKMMSAADAANAKMDAAEKASKKKKSKKESVKEGGTYTDTPKNRKLKRVGKTYTQVGAGNRGGGTKFPQARPKGGPIKPATMKKRGMKSPGKDMDKDTTITRQHAGDRLKLRGKLKKAGGDYANTAMSWDEFDDIPDITDLIPKKKSKKEIKESVKPRRHTVREVRKWMKTLEENRYQKIVKADARRVSWLVNNNLAEEYDSMPSSIRKKWSKANYGKERYLAKEFIKYKKSEKKLRESIRTIIKRLI
jgi:hypothetical protein